MNVFFTYVLPLIVGLFGSAYPNELRALIESGPRAMIATYKRREQNRQALLARTRNSSYELVKTLANMTCDYVLKVALICFTFFVANSIGAHLQYHIPEDVLMLFLIVSPIALALTVKEFIDELDQLPLKGVAAAL